MVRKKILASRKEWLETRKGSIGGSDAAAVIGESPYLSNVALWEIKTGRKAPKDISDLPVVRYGTAAEEHLRELFALDYPEFSVDYQANNLFTNDEYPGIHASLDGWLYDQAGRFGVLEIKTAEIQSAAQKAKWDDKIPDNYFVQLLHEMLVTEAQFAVLLAQLKWVRDGDVFKITKHYRLEREDVENEIEMLWGFEKKFIKSVKEDVCPPLILWGAT